MFAMKVPLIMVFKIFVSILFPLLVSQQALNITDSREAAMDRSSDVKVSALQFDSLSCNAMYALGRSYEVHDEWDVAKDTFQSYIERCYYDLSCVAAFSNIVGDVSSDGSTDDSKWLQLREWFFKVLYLNPDTTYYCEDASAAASTFGYFSGSRGYDVAGQIAVEQYLVESGKCLYKAARLEKAITYLREGWYGHWKDTVTDSLATPFDSTLPSLQQIGFAILLGPQYAVTYNGKMPSGVLGAITFSPNPFVEKSTITYTLNVPATLTMEVYNALGEKVEAPVPSRWTSNGTYTFDLSGVPLPAGTYYIRFSVPEGEVKTIRVTKQ